MSTSASPRDQPLISVVMPVYNRERFLAETITSILTQTYPHLELVAVVDGGSTDGSADAVRAFADRDRRVRPLFLDHGSQGRARNAGIAVARGSLIAHMDDDDVALPQRLSVQLDWMERTGVDICGSCVKRFGTENGLLWFPETHDAIRNELLFRIGLLQPSVLMRSEIARAHAYDENAVYEDYELWTRLASRYRMGNVPQVLLKERCHPQQIHIVKSQALRADQRRFRERYFHELFPEATAEDHAALAQVAERESLSSPGDLAQAGEWLVLLAQTPDNYLRERMAGRWLSACTRSAHLGPDCHRLFRRIAPRFGLSPTRGDFQLRCLCALRLASNSRLYAALASAKRRLAPRPRPVSPVLVEK